jgi:hypothetical protein
VTRLSRTRPAKRVRIPEHFRPKYDRIAAFTGRKPCHHAAEWPI